jgi:23S rRNA pseudouridine1911/1915/1917 synthase
MINKENNDKGKLLADDKNIRLDLYLFNHFNSFSRTKIKNHILKGNILVNQNKTSPSYILKGNEKIYYDFSASIKSISIKPEKINFDIIYEDEYLAVINKPAGLVVHPGSGISNGTLANALVFQFNDLSKLNDKAPGIVHRLDKETSGVMLIAKQDEVHVNLSKQFESRSINKVYRSIVWGNIEESGLINGFIGRDRKNRTTFSLQSKGRDSETAFKKINYFDPLSYVELYPKTGRTHQIRVHLKSISNPIICDESYGGGVSKIRSYHIKHANILKMILESINRVALHAYSIEFTHPKTNEKNKFFAPIPNDFEYILNILKKGKND